MDEADKYWSMRAKNEYLYKGEKLYTITAAPYYVKRREIVIDRLKNIMKKVNVFAKQMNENISVYF